MKRHEPGRVGTAWRVLSPPPNKPLNRTATRNTMHRYLLEFPVRVAAG